MPKGGSPKSDSKNKSKSPKKDDKSPKKVELSPEEIANAPLTHVIFDLDGVLLDSVRSFELFINKLVAPYEKDIPQSLTNKIKDKKIEKVAKIVISELSLPMTIAEFLDYYKDWMPHMLQSVNLMPGANQMISYFTKHKIPIAVVTDCTEENYNFMISRHKLIFNKISHAVCYGSDPEARKPKPDPFIYELAASRFTENVPGGPHNILVFEDTSDGVDAALAAGMKVVWVPDPRADPSEHNFHTNLMVIRSLANFTPQLLKLPWFSRLYSV